MNRIGVPLHCGTPILVKQHVYVSQRACLHFGKLPFWRKKVYIRDDVLGMHVTLFRTESEMYEQK